MEKQILFFMLQFSSALQEFCSRLPGATTCLKAAECCDPWRNCWGAALNLSRERFHVFPREMVISATEDGAVTREEKMMISPTNTESLTEKIRSNAKTNGTCGFHKSTWGGLQGMKADLVILLVDWVMLRGKMGSSTKT